MMTEAQDLICLVVHSDGSYDLGTNLSLSAAIATVRGIVSDLVSQERRREIPTEYVLAEPVKEPER